MDRRSFVNLAAFGGAVLVLPNFLGGCGDGSPSDPEGVLTSGGKIPTGEGTVTPEGAMGGAVVGRGASVRSFTDGNGNLFQAYGSQNRVDFFGPTGALRGRVTAGLNLPVSLAVDGSGRVLLLELGGQRVRTFDLDGRSLGSFASSLPLRYPRDLTIANGSGTVAIADTLNHRIALLDGNGHLIRTLGSLGSRSGELNGPSSVAFAPDGSLLYIADLGNARVQVYSASGRVLDSLGRYGTAPGQFLQPSSLRLDANGYLYIADAMGGYVTVYDPSHSLVSRFRPTLPNGATGVPLWISTRTDGSVLFGTIAGALS
jgi:sugar lactone lactonase YvrE